MSLIMLLLGTTIAQATETMINNDLIEIEDVNTNVINLVADYSNARNSLLVSGNSNGFSDIVFDGIITDEEEHKRFLDENNITISNSCLEIVDICDEEYQITVTAKEHVILNDSPEDVEDIEHIIRVFCIDNQLVVASDNYRDSYSDFKSASYVELTDEETVSLNATGSPLCIVKVAKNEIGYKEKKSNNDLENFEGEYVGTKDYTKYGAWYGANGIAWCAIFVSWCANKANVSTSVIPKYSECTAGLNKFKNWGRFYKRSSSYTPQVGDIFFTGTESDSNHTGIVVDVTSSKITVVDGNWSNQVSTHTYSRTDTSLVGYGNPNYGASSHTYSYTSNSNYHWKKCSACGNTLTKSQHTWVLNPSNSMYTCSVCKRTTTSSPSILSI